MSQDLNNGKDINIDIFWGKSNPEKSLLAHMLDSGNIAVELLRYGSFGPIKKTLATNLNMSEYDVEQTVGYIAAMHDIGKCNPSFQGKGKGLSNKTGLEFETKIVKFIKAHPELASGEWDEGFSHEQYSEDVTRRILLNKKRADEDSVYWVARILKNHHQRLRERKSNSTSEKKWWQDRQDEIECIAFDYFAPGYISLSIEDYSNVNVDAVCMLILGIVVISDWIASGCFFETLDYKGSWPAYNKLSQDTASKAVRECGFVAQDIIHAENGFASMWSEMNTENLRPLQKFIQDLYAETIEYEPMLAIIEGPMGEGKTEAALFVAVKMEEAFEKNGFYVALPTAATSNQMFDRITPLLKDKGIYKNRLLHSTAWMKDELSEIRFNVDDIDGSDDLHNASKWMSPLRRGLLESYAVGTVDQAMLAVLRVQYGVLRLVGLANKVLIIDEIHSYDAYMSKIIIRLLEWCRALSIPVVLLSATLTTEKRNEMICAYGGSDAKSNAYPLVTMVGKAGETKEYAINGTYMKSTLNFEICETLGKWDIVAKHAIEVASRGGCVCVIVNTVKEAQMLYRIIVKCAEYEGKVKLFHAKFRGADRDNIERECLNLYGKDSEGNHSGRPEKSILIATQVVEQSLDLDFDEMVTAICPIDMLLQRSGRRRRHSNVERPASLNSSKMTILIPEEWNGYNPTEYVYPIYILEKTIEQLRKINAIQLPQDIRQLVESVYNTSDVSDDFLEKWFKYNFGKDYMADAANAFILPSPNPEGFYMYDAFSRNYFEDSDTDNNYVLAQTRTGESSTKVALIPGEEYDSLVRGNAKNPRDRNIANKIMKYSISVQSKYVPDVVSPVSGYAPAVDGVGLVNGIKLLKLKRNDLNNCSEYRFSSEKCGGYRYNSEIGIEILKGDV